MIRATVTAQFPAEGPDHRCLSAGCYCEAAKKQAAIRDSGEGSHLKYAVGKAIDNIFKNQRLKGKRMNTLVPVTFTVTDAYIIDGD